MRASSLLVVVLLLAGCSSAHRAQVSQLAPPPLTPSYAPTKSFTKPPSLPGPLVSPVYRKYCRYPDSPLTGVYSPGRLTVKSTCVSITGTVHLIRREHDGDLHLSVSGVPSKWINAVNVNRTASALVVEVVPSMPLASVPAVGSTVTVVGCWVLDTDVGWFEVHPAWAVLAS